MHHTHTCAFMLAGYVLANTGLNLPSGGIVWNSYMHIQFTFIRSSKCNHSSSTHNNSSRPTSTSNKLPASWSEHQKWNVSVGMIALGRVAVHTNFKLRKYPIACITMGMTQRRVLGRGFLTAHAAQRHSSASGAGPHRRLLFRLLLQQWYVPTLVRVSRDLERPAVSGIDRMNRLWIITGLDYWNGLLDWPFLH